MQKPVLVAGGCSFTDPNNWQYFSKSHGVNEIKAWPQVLADIIKDKHGIDYKVINTGRGGASLSKSIDRIQRAVFSEERNIKPHPENLIVLGLTDWWREYSTHTEIDFNPAVHYMYQLKDSIEKGEHPLVSFEGHILNKPENQKRALQTDERMGSVINVSYPEFRALSIDSGFELIKTIHLKIQWYLYRSSVYTTKWLP